MNRTTLLQADDLDYAAFVELQKAAFSEIFRQARISDDFLSSGYFRWKYRPPAGPARIAVVYHGDRLVAANAMFPQNVPSIAAKASKVLRAATLPDA